MGMGALVIALMEVTELWFGHGCSDVTLLGSEALAFASEALVPREGGRKKADGGEKKNVRTYMYI